MIFSNFIPVKNIICEFIFLAEKTFKKTMQIIIALSVVGGILIVALFGVCYW